MRVLAANIEEVFREAAARWTLIAYFILSTLFILLFASAVNLDIVDGALAGAQLFGRSVEMSHADQVDVETLVMGFESGLSGVLYVVGIFLAIFATAHLVPRLQDKGTVDLYLSRPVGRVRMLLYRYLAGLLLAGANVAYLIGSIWLIVMWKTHVVHLRFLLSGAIIMLMVAALLAFAFLVGVITSSTAVSIMSTFGLFLAASILAAHDRIAAVVSSNVTAGIIHTLYWIFPKTSELAQAVVAYVSAGKAPERLLETLSFAPFGTTAAFGIVCLVIASWLFHRKEF